MGESFQREFSIRAQSLSEWECDQLVPFYRREKNIKILNPNNGIIEMIFILFLQAIVERGWEWVTGYVVNFCRLNFQCLVAWKKQRIPQNSLAIIFRYVLRVIVLVTRNPVQFAN